MNAAFTKRIVIVIFIAVASMQLSAQSNYPKYEFGIAAGSLIYQGDLTPALLGSYQFIKPSVQIYAGKILDENFTLRANLVHGNINGDDSRYATPSWRQQRNFKFSTSITELSGLLVWNFYGYKSEGERKKISTYIFGGAGLSFLKVNRDWSNLNTAAFDPKSSLMSGLGADTTHATPGIIPVIPVGAGVKYTISNKLSVNAELMYRITFTDYLDGFSKSADPAQKDYYYGFSVGLIYTLEKNLLRCPKIKN
jgi:hypothetical protein